MALRKAEVRGSDPLECAITLLDSLQLAARYCCSQSCNHNAQALAVDCQGQYNTISLVCNLLPALADPVLNFSSSKIFYW